MTAKHLEHTFKIFGGFAFAIAHMRQGHSALVLVILKRPGLKSFDTFKTFWYNVRLHVEHIPDG